MSGITAVRKPTATTPLDAPVPRQAPTKTLVSTTPLRQGTAPTIVTGGQCSVAR